MSAERYARGRVIPPPIVPTNQEIISFNEILGGALGCREAEAAQQWIDHGSNIDPPAQGRDWIPLDPSPWCFDTRVWDPSSDEEDAGEAIDAPQAGPSQPTKAPRSRAPKQPQIPGENVYSRAAFVSHGDAVGTMSRRKARSSRPTIENPLGDAATAAAASFAKTGVSKTGHPPNPQFPRWAAFDLQLSGPRDRVVPVGPLHVSPTGVICRSAKERDRVDKAETTPIRPEELEKAIEWIQYHAVSSKATIPKKLDAVHARWMVLLERRKTVLRKKAKPQKKRQRVGSSSKGGKTSGKGGPSGSKSGATGSGVKKQKTAKVKKD